LSKLAFHPASPSILLDGFKLYTLKNFPWISVDFHKSRAIFPLSQYHTQQYHYPENFPVRTGEVTQVVELLSSKYEALSSNSHTAKK
jgi:hypothetical protein